MPIVIGLVIIIAFGYFSYKSEKYPKLNNMINKVLDGIAGTKPLTFEQKADSLKEKAEKLEAEAKRLEDMQREKQRIKSAEERIKRAKE
jgi:hypothetical protein